MIFAIILITHLIFTFIRLKKHNIINTQRIVISNNYNLIYNLLFIIGFIIIYIFVFRFLKLFQQRQQVNLFSVLHKCEGIYDTYIANNSLFLGLILIFLLYLFFITLKKLIIQNLKISFISLNYFFINKSDDYFNNYIKIITWQISFWYWLTIKKLKLHKKNNGAYFFGKNSIVLGRIKNFFKYIGIFLLLACFLTDVLINDYNLIFFFCFLPWFGLYQTIYNINWYIQNRLDATSDCNLSDYFYPPAKYQIQQMNFVLLAKLSLYLEDITRF